MNNSQVTKSSYETELRKMTSRFELLTRRQKIKKLHFELLTRRFNFYSFVFELLTRWVKFYFPTFELRKYEKYQITNY